MNEQLENYMADLLQERSPQSVQAFLAAIQEDGFSQQEIDDLRSVVMATLEDPENYDYLIRYLVESGLIQRGNFPEEFNIGFVMTVLGFVGAAQRAISQGA
jgi:hypothetical protein